MSNPNHSSNATAESPVSPEQGLAGRELDAAVAEHVMGWKRELQAWYRPNGKSAEIFQVPQYSTDIAVAMEVRDHIRDTWLFSARRRFVIELITIVSQRLAGTLGVRLADSSVLMNFTAEDICRAALAAVAHNVPENSNSDQG